MNQKQNLMTIATDLFVEKGYDSVSVRDITEKARVNVASINYYFGSKENLFKEIISFEISKMLEDLDFFENAASLEEWLFKWYEKLLDIYDQKSNLKIDLLLEKQKNFSSSCVLLLAAEQIKPYHGQLLALISKNFDNKLNSTEVLSLAIALTCLPKSYAQDRAILEKIEPDFFKDPHWKQKALRSLMKQSDFLIKGYLDETT